MMHNHSPGLFGLLVKDYFRNLTSIREVIEWSSREGALSHQAQANESPERRGTKV